MADLIDRQAAIDALNLADDRGQIHSILDVIDIIKALPSAQSDHINPCTICQEFDCTGCKFRRT